MSLITFTLLNFFVPSDVSDEKLERLIEPMNLLLPHYKITSELRVSAFLATSCFESAYFRTLHEYGKGKGRKYGIPDPVTKLVYYGRGIFQNTWKDAYVNFTRYVRDEWEWIRPLCNLSTAPDFVHDPDLLATPFWAVLAACWYWERNDLSVWADKGVKGFYGLQGLVNRGSAKKKALDYETRLKVYEKVRRLMPDDFDLAVPGVITAEPEEVSQPAPAPEPEEKVAVEVTQDKAVDASGGFFGGFGFDKLSGGADKISAGFDKVQIVTSKVGNSSWAMMALKGVFSTVLMGLYTWYHDPLYFYGSIFLLVLIAVLFTMAKRRAQKRTLEAAKTAADPTIPTVEFVMKAEPV